ncbi:MAG: hypothetical protein RLZZ524_2619, partial [Pseudomonadota bacterium]
MIAGESITLRLIRQTAAGAASTGKVLGDFVVVINGATVTPSGFAEGATVGTWRAYSCTIVAPAAAGTFALHVEPASGTDIVAWSIDQVELNDLDTVANLVGVGVGAVAAVGTGTLAADDAGDVVDGDAWNSGTQTVPLAKLSPFGLSDLTGCTVSAGAKKTTADTSVALTATVVSAAARTLSFGWTTFPAGM